MVVSLTTGKVIPLHWDDRYYLATCPECGDEVSARTSSDIIDILEIHCQNKTKERLTNKMTKYAKNMVKISTLSVALSATTVLLGINAYTNPDVILATLSNMGAFVIGMFALIGLISTMVYMFVGDE